MRKGAEYLLAAALLLALPRGLCAQSSALGGELSIFRFGVNYTHKTENILHSASVGLDLSGPILQRNRVPGFYGNYSCDFLLGEKTWKEAHMYFYAGPGLDFGYGDDFRHPAGIFLGPMAEVRLDFASLRIPCRLSIVFRPTLALHSYKDPISKDLKMGIYSEGLLNSLLPRIGVSYDFEYSKAEKPEEVRQRKVFSYGVELRYLALLEAFNHSNYISEEGGRVDQISQSYHYNTVARVLLGCGCNIGEHVNLSLYSGYQGISKRERIIPILLRPTFLFGEESVARARGLLFLSGGVGLKLSRGTFGVPILAEVGGGYRVPLFGSVKLDFLASVCSIFWHPSIIHDAEQIRRSNQLDLALALGVALNF